MSSFAPLFQEQFRSTQDLRMGRQVRDEWIQWLTFPRDLQGSDAREAEEQPGRRRHSGLQLQLGMTARETPGRWQATRRNRSMVRSLD